MPSAKAAFALTQSSLTTNIGGQETGKYGRTEGCLAIQLILPIVCYAYGLPTCSHVWDANLLRDSKTRAKVPQAPA